MGNLILDSLEIRNFRCFEHLQIEKLGRVNLIVGKNNVGKTALLEALLLYAGRSVWPLVWQMLAVRDEGPWPFHNTEEMLQSLKYLFYGRKDVRSGVNPIYIGQKDFPKGSISLTVVWIDEKGVKYPTLPAPGTSQGFDSLRPALDLEVIGKGPLSVYLNSSPGLTGIGWEEINHMFIPANGLENAEIERLWGNVVLRLEKEVLDALRIVAPGIEGLSFVKTDASKDERLAIVKVIDIEEPIPLRSLGGGMSHTLSIALALVNARNGLLLIDEFENGLHHSALADLWHVVFQIAHRLNIQVFATTHSWDCIEAFQEAAEEDTEEEGMLIRLEVKGEQIKPTLFDEHSLAIVTREEIEVR